MLPAAHSIEHLTLWSKSLTSVQSVAGAHRWHSYYLVHTCMSCLRHCNAACAIGECKHTTTPRKGPCSSVCLMPSQRFCVTAMIVKDKMRSASGYDAQPAIVEALAAYARVTHGKA